MQLQNLKNKKAENRVPKEDGRLPASKYRNLKLSKFISISIKILITNIITKIKRLKTTLSCSLNRMNTMLKQMKLSILIKQIWINKGKIKFKMITQWSSQRNCRIVRVTRTSHSWLVLQVYSKLSRVKKINGPLTNQIPNNKVFPNTIIMPT